MIELIFGGIVYGATILNCYDGDTCNIRLHEAPPILERLPVRLHGLDTPEIRGRCPDEKLLARKARDATIDYISTSNLPWIVIDNRDKYGRIVAEVQGLADHMVSLGLARYYNGGKRQGWCDGT